MSGTVEGNNLKDVNKNRKYVAQVVIVHSDLPAGNLQLPSSQAKEPHEANPKAGH